VGQDCVWRQEIEGTTQPDNRLGQWDKTVHGDSSQPVPESNPVMDFHPKPPFYFIWGTTIKKINFEIHIIKFSECIPPVHVIYLTNRMRLAFVQPILQRQSKYLPLK
jgi:hypothetical protein